MPWRKTLRFFFRSSFFRIHCFLLLRAYLDSLACSRGKFRNITLYDGKINVLLPSPLKYVHLLSPYRLPKLNGLNSRFTWNRPTQSLDKDFMNFCNCWYDYRILRMPNIVICASVKYKCKLFINCEMSAIFCATWNTCRRSRASPYKSRAEFISVEIRFESIASHNV